jgi:hypothetical protein
MNVGCPSVFVCMTSIISSIVLNFHCRDFFTCLVKFILAYFICVCVCVCVFARARLCAFARARLCAFLCVCGEWDFLFLFFSLYSHIHLCIHCLGHFSILPHTPLFSPSPSSLPGRTCFALFSNFIEEKT